MEKNITSRVQNPSEVSNLKRLGNFATPILIQKEHTLVEDSPNKQKNNNTKPKTKVKRKSVVFN